MSFFDKVTEPTQEHTMSREAIKAADPIITKLINIATTLKANVVSQRPGNNKEFFTSNTGGEIVNNITTALQSRFGLEFGIIGNPNGTVHNKMHFPKEYFKLKKGNNPDILGALSLKDTTVDTNALIVTNAPAGFKFFISLDILDITEEYDAKIIAYLIVNEAIKALGSFNRFLRGVSVNTEGNPKDVVKSIDYAIKNSNLPSGRLIDDVSSNLSGISNSTASDDIYFWESLSSILWFMLLVGIFVSAEMVGLAIIVLIPVGLMKNLANARYKRESREREERKDNSWNKNFTKSELQQSNFLRKVTAFITTLVN